MPRGTVLRLGAYRLDVEQVIERKYREKCEQIGLDRLDRVEALSAALSSYCSSLLYPLL